MPFDAKKFLNQYNIHYSDKISNEWVNIKCPMCDDKGKHLGININGAYSSCFRCGSHYIPKVIATLLKVSIPKAKELIKPYLSGETTKQFKIRKYVDEIKYPSGTKPMTNAMRQYLISRRFGPEKLETEYGLLGTGPYGPYANRILAPIYLNSNIISYQCRAIEDTESVKYMTCPDSEECFHLKYSLFNVDKCNSDSVVIVEGIFDVFRLGINSVATFGIDYSLKQVAMVAKRFKRAFIFFDGEDQAAQKADEMAFDLNRFNVTCEIITNSNGDPCDLDNEDAENLMEELL